MITILKTNLEHLQKLKERLDADFYHTTIPYNEESQVIVLGINQAYFRAKKARSQTIVNTLISQGYDARAVLDIDGYYDFYVKPN